MRLPNRKPGKYTFPQFDPYMTEEKFQAMQEKIVHIKRDLLPQAKKDTQQYAENGDFSENADYQIAKARLRGLNKTVDELQYQISNAILIKKPQGTTTVQVGHTVIISTGGTNRTFTILGPTEANPNAGIISFKSPLGEALLGHHVGEIATINAGKKKVEYKILEIKYTI